jgi:uncharacterized protein
MKRSDFHAFLKNGRHYVYAADLVLLLEVDASTYEVLTYIESGGTPSGKYAERWRKFCDYIKDQKSNLTKAKPLRNPDDISDHIIGLYLFVSQKCNLRCTYCYGDKGEYGMPGNMHDKVVEQTFDCFFNNGKKHQVTFFGGEPLMNLPAIEKAIDLSDEYRKNKKADISFNIVTNGTICNKKVESIFRDRITDVTFSLDGPKSINDSQRPSMTGQSSYDKISKNIEYLTKNTNINWAFRSIVTHQSCDQVLEIFNHLNKFNPGGIGLIDVDVPVDHPLYLNDDEYVRFVRQLIELNRLGLNSFIDGKQPIDFEYQFIILYHFVSRTHTLYHCNAGTNLLAITADGDVYPCHRFVGIDEFHMGNVSDQSIRERVRFKKIRSLFTHCSVDERSVCCNCWARYLCGGSCVKYSYSKHGDLKQPVQRHCLYIKSVIEALLPDVADIIKQPTLRSKLMRNLRAGLINRVGTKRGDKAYVS